MNYEWKLASSKGQKGTGYIEIHNAIVEGHYINATISFFPQITDYTNKKNVNVCLLFEGKKEELTDGLFHCIYDDIGEIVKQKEKEYFEQDSDILEFIITQTLVADRMPQLELISHGDYTILRT